MTTEGSCEHCHYEKHLSVDIQCPVIGIGETLDNEDLLEKYGTLEDALKAYGLDDETMARQKAAWEAMYSAKP